MERKLLVVAAATNPLVWVGFAGFCFYKGLLLGAVAFRFLRDEMREQKRLRLRKPSPKQIFNPVSTTPALCSNEVQVDLSREATPILLTMSVAAQTVEPTAVKTSLESMSDDELRTIARERGIKGVNSRWGRKALLGRLKDA